MIRGIFVIIGFMWRSRQMRRRKMWSGGRGGIIGSEKKRLRAVAIGGYMIE